MAPWFEEDTYEAQAYIETLRAAPKTHVSKELLVGAASFEAALEYEKHVAAHGKPESHAEAKSILSGVAQHFLNRVIEDKELVDIDRSQVEWDVREKLDKLVDKEGY
ncbi:cipC protein [Auriscalpium vulgare]|uniref:CipC protein n=1 Tax=Auriscalpium vulgare TaxID=40419 RepID=A0ACB8SC62_9AGAM|nr:cipC protein [Auriscalpium vulgare]